MNWLAILLFAGASQAVLLAVLILFIKTGSRLANIFLANFLGLIALRLLLNFFVYADIPLYTPFYGLYTLQTLIGPALYLYVRALTESDFKLSPRLGWHMLILLPALLLYFVRLSQVDVNSVVSGISVLKEDNLGIQIISAVLSLLYGAMSLHKLSLHRSLIEQAFSVIEEVSLIWLKWLILLFITVKILHLAMVVLSEMNLLAFELRTWLSLLSSLGVLYLISIGGLRQPLIFTQSIRSIMVQIKDEQTDTTHSENDHSSIADADPTPADTARPQPGHKYKKSGLDDDRMASIWQQLQRVMEEQQPHLTSSALNMAELAEMTAVKPSDLSRVINNHARVNFYDFINGYRVKAAQRLLDTPTTGKVTMLETAMAVGFNSQSTFYSHFKKHTGLTPKQYRDQQSH